MPSPFPGMNPYLEQEGLWLDFHETYVIALRAALVPQILPNYVAIIEQHVYVREPEGERNVVVVRPDTAIVDQTGESALRPGGTALAAPTYVDLSGPALDVERESFIEVRDRNLRRVITVVELLSPSNKRPGDDRSAYLAKRNRYLKSGVNLVEIDLLRGWPRMPMRNQPRCDYCVMISQRSDWPSGGFWPILLRDSLPAIPVPLGDEDKPATLDLQALLHQVYDSVGYEAWIYNGSPTPPLGPEDEKWANGLVPSRRKGRA
jgi:hypothetical protein